MQNNKGTYDGEACLICGNKIHPGVPIIRYGKPEKTICCRCVLMLEDVLDAESLKNVMVKNFIDQYHAENGYLKPRAQALPKIEYPTTGPHGHRTGAGKTRAVSRGLQPL